MIISFHRKETGDLLQDLVNFAADKAKERLFAYQDLGRKRKGRKEKLEVRS